MKKQISHGTLILRLRAAAKQAGISQERVEDFVARNGAVIKKLVAAENAKRRKASSAPSRPRPTGKAGRWLKEMGAFYPAQQYAGMLRTVEEAEEWQAGKRHGPVPSNWWRTDDVRGGLARTLEPDMFPADTLATIERITAERARIDDSEAGMLRLSKQAYKDAVARAGSGSIGGYGSWYSTDLPDLADALGREDGHGLGIISFKPGDRPQTKEILKRLKKVYDPVLEEDLPAWATGWVYDSTAAALEARRLYLDLVECGARARAMQGSKAGGEFARSCAANARRVFPVLLGNFVPPAK